jgi:hypothetical protein
MVFANIDFEEQAMAAVDFRIKKKKNGRYQVRLKGGKNINGLDKVKFLVDKKLIKTKLPKAKTEGEDSPAGEKG